MEGNITKVRIADKILQLAARIIGWESLGNPGGLYLACNGDTGEFIDRTDSESIAIDKPVEFEGRKYTSINLYGDFTLEFCDEEGESICWSEFNEDFLNTVLQQLTGK